MTVLNIAGTSGSGKSHLMRSFIDWAMERGKVKEVWSDKEHAMAGYEFAMKRFDRPIHIVGAYDTPTGGCDTARSAVKIFDIVREQYALGKHVLYEGLFVMNHTRGTQLAAELGEELCIIQLTTPYSVCIASINVRRGARGDGKLLTKDNTRGNYVRAENYCTKMRGAGARVIRVAREKGLETMISVLSGDWE